MIPLFKKIRKKMANDNRPMKYIRYAIGEIILVVIGILIALQINNWNESNKALNAELQLYSKLLEDVNSQQRRTNREINKFKSYQDVHYHVYNETKGRAPYDSTLYYNSLQWIWPFHLDITEKYNESLTSITNDNIRDILKYYIRKEKETKDAYDEWNELKVERLRPFFNKHGIHNTEGIFNDNRYDFYTMTRVNLIDHAKFKEQFGTTDLDELFFDLRFKTSWIFSKLNELRNVNISLKLALKNELELHNRTPWKQKENYDKLITEADILYESKDYQQSANKYKAAFELSEAKPNDKYNAACSFALTMDKESAFDHLFELANGPFKYYDLEHITTDSDLDILHDDTRWKELIEIVNSNKEATEIK